MRLPPMVVVLMFVAVSSLSIASCTLGGGPTSDLGDSCTKTGDCIRGKCIALQCKAEPNLRCTTSSECSSHEDGAACLTGSCRCQSDSDCLTAKDMMTSKRNPYCYRGTDGGLLFGDSSFCSEFK